jgi:hypothetical protein
LFSNAYTGLPVWSSTGAALVTVASKLVPGDPPPLSGLPPPQAVTASRGLSVSSTVNSRLVIRAFMCSSDPVVDEERPIVVDCFRSEKRYPGVWQKI